MVGMGTMRGDTGLMPGPLLCLVTWQECLMLCRASTLLPETIIQPILT